MSSIARWLMSLPPGLILGLAFLLPAAEASVFVGVLIPGETVVLVAGVLAQAGVLPLWAVMAAAVSGAVVGDQVGFWVGRRYGAGLLDRMPPRLRRRSHPDRVLAFVRRRGVLAVVLGRWTASLRALVPGIAGMSGLRPRTFTLANAAGGLVWGVTVALVGYLAGVGYGRIESRINQAGWLAVGGLALVLLVVSLVRRGRRSREPRDPEPASDLDTTSPDTTRPSTTSPTTDRRN